jgi:hypothetical protein
MITEDYVSFEVAKLLKEKGFKHWCYKSYGDAVYHKGVPISFDEECDLKSEGLEDEIEYVEGGYLYDFGCNNSSKDIKEWAAPTLWVAMKWLREMHNLHISVNMGFDVDNSQCFFYVPFVCRFSNKGGEYITPFDDEKEFDSCEEATEATIKYCLKNLMKNEYDKEK